jgi:hypothetical protein
VPLRGGPNAGRRRSVRRIDVRLVFVGVILIVFALKLIEGTGVGNALTVAVFGAVGAVIGVTIVNRRRTDRGGPDDPSAASKS